MFIHVQVGIKWGNLPKILIVGIHCNCKLITGIVLNGYNINISDLPTLSNKMRCVLGFHLVGPYEMHEQSMNHIQYSSY